MEERFIRDIDFWMVIQHLHKVIVEQANEDLAHEYQTHISVAAEPFDDLTVTYSISRDDTGEAVIVSRLKFDTPLSSLQIERIRSLMQLAENGDKHTIEDLDKYNLAWDEKHWRCNFCSERFLTHAECVLHEQSAHR